VALEEIGRDAGMGQAVHAQLKGIRGIVVRKPKAVSNTRLNLSLLNGLASFGGHWTPAGRLHTRAMSSSTGPNVLEACVKKFL